MTAAMNPPLRTADRTAVQGKDVQPRAFAAILRVAVNFGFGVPTVWGAAVLIRGRQFWSDHHIFGDALGGGAAHLSVLVAALAMLWMGAIFLLSGGVAKKATGASLLAVGAAVIFALRP